ncbi:hypothetical protein ACFQZE_21070 [Paenibacillus sp. GCM10027627]|uniref:hypothetical protein n=1 Tax=unclassified Paenibacillus TaxID=185978 RepID=UPI003628B660
MSALDNTVPPAAVGNQPAEREKGRSWRVGTLSMGFTLMLIGTAFAVSLWQEIDAYDMLLWVAPLVFILLGLELLIYLFVSGKRDTVIRYDWISVFFVGLVGFASVVMALLMSTGLFDELERQMKTTERTVYVESEKAAVPDKIIKIVLQSPVEIAIDKTSGQELQLLGQIRYWSDEALSRETASKNIMTTKTIGDVMYVFVNPPDAVAGSWFSVSADPGLTLAIPDGVALDRRYP